LFDWLSDCDSTEIDRKVSAVFVPVLRKNAIRREIPLKSAIEISEIQEEETEACAAQPHMRTTSALVRETPDVNPLRLGTEKEGDNDAYPKTINAAGRDCSARILLLLTNDAESYRQGAALFALHS
jgi:hypothetical protein